MAVTSWGAASVPPPPRSRRTPPAAVPRGRRGRGRSAKAAMLPGHVGGCREGLPTSPAPDHEAAKRRADDRGCWPRGLARVPACVRYRREPTVASSRRDARASGVEGDHPAIARVRCMRHTSPANRARRRGPAKRGQAPDVLAPRLSRGGVRVRLACAGDAHGGPRAGDPVWARSRGVPPSVPLCPRHRAASPCFPISGARVP
jgi:hypothetical protein